MTPEILRAMAERYEHRKEAKQRFDQMITLSAAEGGEESNMVTLAAYEANKTVRLLDEGMVVDKAGKPHLYLKKGVLQAFYDELSEDYVGSINIGHQKFATFPFLVGQWTKQDLSLVDIGDGRMGLDVKLNLDEESLFVKELRRLDYQMGISAEFLYTKNAAESIKLGVPAIDRVNITDFGIVGEAGNVNSGGLSLKGDDQMADKKKPGLLENLFSKYLSADDKPESTETIDPEQTEEKTEDNTEKDQNVSKDKTEANKDEEENKTTSDDQQTEEKPAVSDEELAALAVEVETIMTENERLTAQETEMLAVLEAMETSNKEKDTRIAELEAKLSIKDQQVETGFSKFQEIAAKLNIQRTETPDAKKAEAELTVSDEYLSEDGMGEL
ncbi:hypothetical protein [Enterococcus sp. DIV0800]|uniref:hypothetical protein n=1 Tax=unclassified Enterococcus TaxID=2608891 RepID=UPI003D2FB03A